MNALAWFVAVLVVPVLLPVVALGLLVAAVACWAAEPDSAAG